jgi:hypothetical protein
MYGRRQRGTYTLTRARLLRYRTSLMQARYIDEAISVMRASTDDPLELSHRCARSGADGWYASAMSGHLLSAVDSCDASGAV